MRRATRRLRTLVAHVERLTVRFIDVNGPRGGVDAECRIKVVVSGAPSVHATARAKEPEAAFIAALDLVATNLRTLFERKGWRAPQRAEDRGEEHAPAAGPESEALQDEPGSLIGRRVGRATANLEDALLRPEKERRDQPVDTAQAGVSATDRRAGGAHTARRNTQRRAPTARATLEDSTRDRPSRKSTRKSRHRGKQDDQLRLRATLRTRAPKARASRARSRP